MPLQNIDSLRQTRDELGDIENTNFIRKNFNEQMFIRNRTTVQSLNQLDNVTLWGEFDWGDGYWGGPPAELGFQFDSGVFGVMGENTFGLQATIPTTHYNVFNYNDTWIWDIDTETIIDSNNKVTRIGFTDYDLTTATEDVNASTITIELGEVWTSHPIYRDGSETISKSSMTFTSFSGTVNIPSGYSVVWEYGAVYTGQGLVWTPFTWGTTVNFEPTFELRIRARVVGD